MNTTIMYNPETYDKKSYQTHIGRGVQLFRLEKVSFYKFEKINLAQVCLSGDYFVVSRLQINKK